MGERTVFQLQTDPSGIFDGSFHARSISATGAVRPLKSGALNFRGRGSVSIPRSDEYDTLEEFTINATILLKNTSGRQNIIEAQTPPVALFVDRGGKLKGSVHTGRGWQSVTSGNVSIQPNRATQVTFTRDRRGAMRLEIGGRKVGSRTVRGRLVPVGDQGFLIGVGMNRRSFQFEGQIKALSVNSAALDSNLLQQRLTRARGLQGRLRANLNLSKLFVSANRDESYARLQPVKSILASVGVENLNDLAPMKIPDQTVMTPGKIVLAPRKKNVRATIDWSDIAGKLRTGNVTSRRKTLARLLPNRNSANTLKRARLAAHATSTPVPPSRGTPAAPLAAGATGAVSFLTADRFSRRLISRSITEAPTLSAVIDLEADELTLRDSGLVDRLKSSAPVAWPQMSQQQFHLLSSHVLPIDSSVIVANSLDLRSVELQVDPEVARLFIIAEEIKVNANSRITWRRPGGSTPPRADEPDLNGRSYSGQHLKPGSWDGLDGENGRNGSSGITGAGGRSAPALEIWTRSMNGMPNLDLNGENGIRGGRGQTGGRGGNGADGRVGKRAWFFGWHCTRDPGDGGDGGNGGDGGPGGRGGPGGDGGDIVIGVLEGTLESTVTANSFRIKNQGGQKGRGGDGGPGGAGGRGGQSGAGKTCKDADDGHPGAQGQRGRSGNEAGSAGGDGSVQFHEFTQDAWEELLLRPWITEAMPEYVFPNDSLTLTGSAFTPSDRVLVGSHTLAPTVNPDDSISVTIPGTISGGEKVVYVRRPDGTESNRVRLWVKPQLDPLSGPMNPGATFRVNGRAFINGASVIIDGESVPADFVSANELSCVVPGTGGAGSSEQTVQVQVINPDGMLSNLRSATIPSILEIPFRFPDHALQFDNFKNGAPSWSTYEKTYGAAEIYHELLDPLFGHPILTAAFYAFYHYFLKGEDRGGLATGFCTSMSARVLDEFWTGSTDTITRVELDSATRANLTAIHGRLLSRESLIHFHDQGREGVSRVLKTYREIENTFRNGCDRFNAPMLFFIPSGAIWDDGYVDSLGDSHCIVPTRFVYPEGHPGPSPDGTTDPDGVTLYCWDCNHPPTEDTAAVESENCRLVFRRTGGVIHYDYFDGGNSVKFCSEDGVTLGMMTNGKYLHSDHDLPFSGPFGVRRFVLDFLLSPADLQVTDDNGLRTGNFGGQLFSEIPDSLPCYMMKGAYLLPSDVALNREIVGNASGNYAFHTISPAGTSVSLEDVPTNAGEIDRLSMNGDGTQIRITPGASKAFALQIARKVGPEIRAVSVSGAGGSPLEEVDITVAPDLSVVRLGNRSAARQVDVKAIVVNETTRVNATANRGNVALAQNHDLLLTIADWESLDMDVATMGF